jgi:hypothetical protein
VPVFHATCMNGIEEKLGIRWSFVLCVQKNLGRVNLRLTLKNDNSPLHLLFSLSVSTASSLLEINSPNHVNKLHIPENASQGYPLRIALNKLHFVALQIYRDVQTITLNLHRSFIKGAPRRTKRILLAAKRFPILLPSQ